MKLFQSWPYHPYSQELLGFQGMASGAVSGGLGTRQSSPQGDRMMPGLPRFSSHFSVQCSHCPAIEMLFSEFLSGRTKLPFNYPVESACVLLGLLKISSWKSRYPCKSFQTSTVLIAKCVVGPEGTQTERKEPIRVVQGLIKRYSDFRKPVSTQIKGRSKDRSQ